MPLKKPSEFYDKNNNSSFDEVKEELKNSQPEKVEKISEAFDSFKGNLNNIQALNDFVEKFDTFKANAQKVEGLSSSVEEIRESINGLIGQKDLDDAMMAHLLFVEESIRNVQDKVKTLNSNSVLEIKNEFDSLSEAVNQFLVEEVPSYKKLIVDSETRVDGRFSEFTEDVKKSFETLETAINNDVANISTNLEGINEESLSGIKEDVHGIGEKVKILLEKELPEYKKFFAETEVKTEKRIVENEELVDKKLQSVEENYNNNIKGVEKDIKRNRKNILESKIKVEEDIQKVSKLLAEDILTLDQKVSILDVSLTSINEDIKGKDVAVNNVLSDQVARIEDLVEESKILSDTFRKDFKNREISSDKKLEEYANTLVSFSEKISNLEDNLSDNILELQENLDTSTSKYHDTLKSDVEGFENTLTEKLKDLQINFTVNEKHIDSLKDEFQLVVEKLQIDEVEKKNKELFSKVKHLEEILEQFNDKEILTEGLLNIPPNVDNSDPLTPLDKRYVTTEQLSQHYRLFVNRVQQQLATFGGGGEVFLARMQDVAVGSGIQTNNWVLAWDTSESLFVPSAGGSSGAGGTWGSDSVGVYTGRNVGVATTARSDYALYVEGDGRITGDWNITGDLVYDEATARNWNVTGVATATTLHVGVGTTWSEDLVVTGDARVTGILTIGTGSIIIDGANETINIGNEDVTITNSQITIGSGVTLSATASGINSAPNVLYVAKDGLDTNNGTSIDNAKLTIKAAVGAASSGTTVKVLSGKYTESNPISVPAFVSIVGDDQRTVEVTPSTATSDIFHVRKGVKLANMTFKGHTAPAAAVAFPTDEIAENVGGGKWKGPYIQNCSSDTTTGTGVYIDGDQARLLKAMNVDAFTQYNEGGVGVAVTNGGFAQLVSLFTICCNEAVTCDKGGQADIANSNCSFGTYGLVARGVSDLQYTGVVTSTAAISQKEAVVNVSTPTLNISNFIYDYTSGLATVTTSAAHGFSVGMGVTVSGIGLTCAYGTKTYPHRKPFIFDVLSIPSTTSFTMNAGISTLAHTYVSGGTAKIDIDRPYDGQLVYFDTLYKNVTTIAVSAGGTGYTSTPAVTVEAPGGPSGETCTAYATLDGGSVDTVTIISSGSQYTATPTVTIGGPDVGVNTATATASMADHYYTINSSTPISSGISTLTLDTNLLNAVGVGSTVYFNQGSRIIASSHTFEYVGAGNQIATATPKRGGVTIQANEVLTSSGGRVLYTSTDQAGNFRIGDDLQINQNTGTISGRSFTKSLFNEMTPFILALS